MERCVYCGEERNEKTVCCGEMHFESEAGGEPAYLGDFKKQLITKALEDKAVTLRVLKDLIRRSDLEEDPASKVFYQRRVRETKLEMFKLELKL